MPLGIPPLWAAIAVAIALTIGAGSGWRAHTIYDKAEERDKLAGTIVQMQVDANESRQISQEVQTTLAGLQVVNRTINKEVQREIIEKPVYRDVNCALPESGRLRLSTVIDAANRAGRLEPSLPAPAAGAAQPGPAR